MNPKLVLLYKQGSIAITGMTGAWFLGAWFERHEDERMTKFRDKSALYGKTLKPGQPPSWP